jgi:ABC-type sugar transport system permease subunit
MAPKATRTGIGERWRQATAPKRRQRLFVSLFLLPALVPYLALYIYPAIHAFYISLFDWSGFNKDMRFVGLANYERLLHDAIFLEALKHNMIAVFGGGAVMLSLALFFAILITKGARGSRFFKTVITAPFLLSGVAVAIFWKFVLDPQFGLLNGVLTAVGLDNLTQPWLGDRDLAFPAILAGVIWWWIGLFVLIIAAGIQRIPTQLWDAAKVDGATEWQTTVRITIPLIWDVLAVAAVLWIIDALRLFDIVWVMTKGGPGNSTHVLGTYLYSVGFGERSGLYQLGRGTAIGVVLFALVFVSSVVYLRLTRRKAIEY